MTNKELLILTSEKSIPGGRLQEVIGLYIPFETEFRVRRIARKTDRVVFKEDHEDVCLHKTRTVLNQGDNDII